MSPIQLLAPGPERPSSFARLPHVLLVVDCFPKTLGGGERIALRLASLLPRAGFRVSLLTFAVHADTSFQMLEAPCPVYLLPLNNTYGIEALRGALALRRLLREHKVELVQTFFESSDLWAGLVTRLFSSAKLVWSRRDMGILRQRKHSLAYRLLRRLPHGVFAVSARVAEHVIGVDGVARDKVRVVYNGLDLVPRLTGPALTSTAGKPRTAGPVITTIGNVRHVKGHDVLMEAAAQVLAATPQARFTVAGDVLDSAYFEQLEARLHSLGFGDRFEFLGKITDLARHLSTADVFVLPSRSEGFSNALIEAMSTGLPVVATDVGGNAEAVQDGVNGFIVPPDDPAALARAILALIADPRKAEQFGRAAQETVAAKFTAEAMLGVVSAAYRELLCK